MEADMTKIYLITNLINGKQYVGKTRYSLAHRFSQHCNNEYYNTYIHNAIKKYGKNNFKIEELCRCDDEHWQELEQFYIKKLHTHYSEGGYNITWGGDSNPMDNEETRVKHKSVMSSDEMISRTRRPLDEWNFGNSEKRLAFNKRTSERQSGIYVDAFKSYNDRRSIKVGMMDDTGEIVQEFESVADALRFLDKPTKEAGRLLRYADKFNKNGKRAKFFGYSWIRLK